MNEKSLKVLEQYDIEITGTRRGRGSYICETGQGKLLLTNTSASEKKLLFVNRVLKMMKEKGCAYADAVLENKEGNLLTPDWDEPPCILKEWYEGRECDTRNLRDVEQTVRYLSQLHRWMKLEPLEGENISFAGEHLREEMERHNRELRKVYAFVRRRKQKNEFEILLLNCFQTFYEQAQEALSRLSGSGYQELWERERQEGRLCHGNFNQHNVWFLGRGQIFACNFEKCRYDVQAADLYQFMRKIMEKQDWNRYTGSRMLELYDREKRLDKSQREYLYIRLLYPEKFWKLLNQYYNRNKAWVPQKSAEKLETLIGQEKVRNSFLKILE